MHTNPKGYDRSSEGRLLNVAQVMSALNCSRSFVYKLIGMERLKAVRLGEYKGIRVTERSLELYRRRCAVSR